MHAALCASTPSRGTIDATVKTMDGKQLDLQFVYQLGWKSDQPTVGAVKNQILAKWTIPLLCQRLLCEHCGQVLNDWDYLFHHVLPPRSWKFSALFCVSLELPLRQLKQKPQSFWHHSRSTDPKKEALEALAATTIHGTDEAVSIVATLLQEHEQPGEPSKDGWTEHQDPAGRVYYYKAATGDISCHKPWEEKSDDLRHLAAQVLKEWGKKRTIDELLAWLQHDKVSLRLIAVEALLDVAPSDKPVLVAIFKLLDDPNVNEDWRSFRPPSLIDELPCRVAHLLIAEYSQEKYRGNHMQVLAWAQLLQSQQSNIRNLAVEGLSKGLLDDENIIAMADGLLEHPLADVRNTAVQVLHNMTTRDNVFAQTRLKARLQHPEAYVRVAGVEALREVSDRGDDQVIAAMLELLDDPDNLVRRAAAITVMAQVGERGDERAILAACTCLADEDANIRTAAVHSLSELADKGNEVAVMAVANKLKHVDPSVRCAAVASMGQVAARDDREALKSVSLLLNDESPDVRRGSLQTLVDLAGMGSEFVISMVKPCMQDCDASVRCAAMEALSEISEFADPQTISATTKQLGDGSLHVRRTAVEILLRMLKGGEKAAVFAITDEATAELQRGGVSAKGAATLLGNVAVGHEVGAFPPDERAVVACFQKWDLDCNGRISSQELTAIMSELLPHLSRDQLNLLFRAADANRDGEINYVEFVSWIFMSTEP